jgi:hypothetical protein
VAITFDAVNDADSRRTNLDGADPETIDRICTPRVGTVTRFASSLERVWCDPAAIDDRQRIALIIEVEMFKDRRMLRQ